MTHLCSTPGCLNTHTAKGLCHICYSKAYQKSEKYKAYRQAYLKAYRLRHSDKHKAYQRAYRLRKKFERSQSPS